MTDDSSSEDDFDLKQHKYECTGDKKLTTQGNLDFLHDSKRFNLSTIKKIFDKYQVNIDTYDHEEGFLYYALRSDPCITPKEIAQKVKFFIEKGADPNHVLLILLAVDTENLEAAMALLEAAPFNLDKRTKYYDIRGYFAKQAPDAVQEANEIIEQYNIENPAKQINLIAANSEASELSKLLGDD